MGSGYDGSETKLEDEHAKITRFSLLFLDRSDGWNDLSEKAGEGLSGETLRVHESESHG
jgi:hypothetical protein